MNWLNRERIVVYPRIFFAVYIAVYFFTIIPVLNEDKIIDRNGIPVGADFSGFYAASKLALSEKPVDVYNVTKMQSAQENLVGAKLESIGGWFWVYPPTFLMFVLPFSLLPYFVSLAIWLATTFFGYVIVLRCIAPSPFTFWLILGFPGTFQNFIHGQNGFLSVTILGGGLLLLERFPFAGGFILGLLTYKPQLAVLIPVALLAGRRWKTLLGALVSALCLAIASILVMGFEVWVVFVKNIPLTTKVLQSGILPIYKMGTVFNLALLNGASVRVATILQAFVMIGVAAAVFWVWYQDMLLPIRGSVLALSTLLFTPYAFPYEFVLLSLPVAWLGWEGYTKYLMPAEKYFLTIIWLLPLLIPLLGKTKLQATPLILMILLMITLKRGREEICRRMLD